MNWIEDHLNQPKPMDINSDLGLQYAQQAWENLLLIFNRKVAEVNEHQKHNFPANYIRKRDHSSEQNSYCTDSAPQICVSFFFNKLGRVVEVSYREVPSDDALPEIRDGFVMYCHFDQNDRTCIYRWDDQILSLDSAAQKILLRLLDPLRQR